MPHQEIPKCRQRIHGIIRHPDSPRPYFGIFENWRPLFDVRPWRRPGKRRWAREPPLARNHISPHFRIAAAAPAVRQGRRSRAAGGQPARKLARRRLAFPIFFSSAVSPGQSTEIGLSAVFRVRFAPTRKPLYNRNGDRLAQGWEGHPIRRHLMLE